MTAEKPSGRELLFIEHPDAFLDPVKAAVDVGYAPETAKKYAYVLRKKFEFDLVEKARARLEGLAVTPTWVQNEVTILAKTSATDFHEFVEDALGNQQLLLKKLVDIDPDKWRAAIKEIEFDTVMHGDQLRSRVSKIVLYDRQKALLDLARLLGMMNEKLLLQMTRAPESTEDVQAKLIKYATMDELKEIAEIFDGISERLNKRADKLRDDRALEHDDGST